MNQYGFIEISVIKNERPYRALLPLGVSWKDAHGALLELTQQVADHIAAIEAQQAAAESQQAEAEQTEPTEPPSA